MATGDQADVFSRIKSLLPASWFQDETPVADALIQGPSWALSNAYAQITYAALQQRIKTATDMWLDVISQDFFNGALPRLTNETDGAFKSRILANLFVKGPTRANMAAVLTLITGRAPTIFEPQKTADSGGWDGGFYFDTEVPAGGGWGDPLAYQCMITVYRPAGGLIDLGEFDAYTFSWDSWGAWSDSSPTSITDASIIAAVETTKPVGTIVWMRIANSPITP